MINYVIVHFSQIFLISGYLKKFLNNYKLEAADVIGPPHSIKKKKSSSNRSTDLWCSGPNNNILYGIYRVLAPFVLRPLKYIYYECVY